MEHVSMTLPEKGCEFDTQARAEPNHTSSELAEDVLEGDV